MRRFLPLLLCLSLSLFTLARAIKPTHTLASDTRNAPKLPVEQQADSKALFKHPSTEQETGPNDNDNKDDASADEGEDANNDDAGDAVADEDPGDDNGADDDAGDDNGDDGGQ